ncbi:MULTISPECIES: (2Fe-2S)-binding protein [Halolamina]|uniref:Carbon-monoxide dehydrogenase small subunit n=1 Tax=Halolamina pelagica TaxID=699431 RepID=A0A1I5QVV3_9EURY|nr:MULTISPECIES: (2Fe-2S)-binding protein [Halolamina]NHX35561.1 (2Fe-2S)-binding protein [Halolamina sp. R1-12]SFP50250.1 carbon-monoxide dehydrogenase small subunit [Halolamina pelagica]
MSEHEIAATVDGATETATVEARRLLVHALRENWGYTQPTVGCESGKCGACTVEMDGEVVKSCCVLAVQADGSEITTVGGIEGAPDGLAEVGGDDVAAADDDGFGPVQRSFHEEHGLQCGYCTPGMILRSRDLLAANPDPSREEIREGLKGNVCRCTGYENVVDAVEAAARKLEPIETDGGAPEDAVDAADGGAD